MANELLSTIARLDFVEEGLQEFVLDNFSDERMFPFSESLIDLMVQSCKNLTKLHLTSMKTLSDESRNDFERLFIGIVKAGAQLRDIDIQCLGVSEEQGQRMIESCITEQLTTITHLNM